MANTLYTLTEYIGKVFSTLQDLFLTAKDSITFVTALGWELPPGFENLELNQIDLTDFLEKLRAVLEASDEEFEDELFMAEKIIDLGQATRRLVVNINEFGLSLVDVFTGFDDFVERTQIHKELPRRLLDLLIVSQLSESSPLAVSVLRFLNLIEFKHFPADPDNFQLEHVRVIVHYGNLGNFLSDPSGHMQATYGWGTPEFLAFELLDRFGEILRELGIPPQLKTLNPKAEAMLLDQPAVDPDLEPMPQIMITLYEKLGEIAGLKVGLTAFGVRPSAEGASDGGLGFLPVIRGEAEASFPFFAFDDSFIDLDAEAKLLKQMALILRPDQDLQLKTANDFNDNLTGRFAIGLRHGSPASDIKSLLTFPGGLGFQYQQVYLKGGLQKSFDRIASFIELGLLGGKLGLSLEEADGFLKKSIPQEEMESPFDLRIGWNSQSGIYFQGSSGLIVSMPIHVNIGPFDLTSLTLALNIAEEGLSLESSVDGVLTLGPLHAGVQRIGMEMNVTFEAGNLGFFDLSPSFKPPTGIGLVVDGGGFKGGGFLDFDPENERYSGMLELEYQGRIALKAIGLLTTRLPSGEKGFSLLIIITSEFTPIQLGFGFTLNGVGGLLGLNRTVETERLRTGIRDNTLSSILFPQNIVANADRIISDLRQVFPPQDGRFVFGPMARIGWGSPTLITIDLGLLIEVPNPIRLILLGEVKGLLPTEDEAVLRIQVNFLGVINFEKKQLSFDASLYDSTLLTYTLTGDMALRLYWGADPNFLLTVGGFHPAYQPPPMNLPDIRRLTIQLLASDNLRITTENYFAVTSNTVQFGAKTEVYAGAGKFNVYGFMSYDVLFQFSPFRFIADISAMLALRVGSSSFASIKLAFTLEGPTPWKANGTASLKICWFLTIKVRFSKTWGAERHISLPDVPVMPLLLAALNDRGNWRAELPQARHMLVSTKEVAPEDLQETILVHPHGLLNISQKVVPLNLHIEKFGNFRPADGNEFRISEVEIGSATPVPNPAPAKEYFAPAQFFEKEDAEKLSSPSFEQYDSGIRLQETEQLRSAYAAAREVKYELSYIDSQRDQQRVTLDELVELDPGAFNTWTLNGATALSELSQARNGKAARAPEEVTVSGEDFGIVFSSDLTLFDNDSLWASEAEALAYMDALIEEDPVLEGQVQVVAEFEVAW